MNLALPVRLQLDGPRILDVAAVARGLERGDRRGHLRGGQPEVEVAHRATGRVRVHEMGEGRALEQDGDDARGGQRIEDRGQFTAVQLGVGRRAVVGCGQRRREVRRQAAERAGPAEAIAGICREALADQPVRP